MSHSGFEIDEYIHRMKTNIDYSIKIFDKQLFYDEIDTNCIIFVEMSIIWCIIMLKRWVRDDKRDKTRKF